MRPAPSKDRDRHPDRDPHGDPHRDPRPYRQGRLLRGVVGCAWLLAACLTLALLLGVARTAWRAIAQPGPAEPADGLLLAVGLAGAGLVLWFGAAVLLAGLATLPGRVGAACAVIADRLAPAFARRIVAVVLGSSLSAAAVPGSGATAADADPGAPGAPRVVAVGVPDPALRPVAVTQPRPELVATGARPGAAVSRAPSSSSGPRPHAASDTQPEPAWMPTRPAPRPRSTQGGLGALRSGGMRHVDEHVVVRRGDTLWTVAGRYLGPDATAAQIAAEWPRWHAANRVVIGDDPDLLLPGQRLLPPDVPKANR